MVIRVLTAVVALLVVLPIIVWGGFWGLSALGALAVLIGVHEFSQLSGSVRRRDIFIGEMIGAMGVYWATLLAQDYSLTVVALVVLGVYLLHLFRFKEIENAGPQLMGSIASVFYIPFLLSFLPLIRLEKDGLEWVYFLMLVTWAGDSGAYLFGRTFGRHKLYAQVSPKKTIEGVLGGALASVLGAFLARATFFDSLTVAECLLLAPVADIAGVLGDLAESLLKRSAGIKDSGNIFPGHGGVLDRVDSLLFSTPLVYAYVMFLR